VKRRNLACGIALAAAAMTFGHFNLRPTHEREWRTEQAVLPRVNVESGTVHVRGVRDFTFHSASEFTPRFVDRSYDLDRLESVWLVVSPFSRDWRGPAHIFLSFGFQDSTFVSISVEARREVGEEYSIWKGALRRFELMYVIGEETDLIGLRAVTWDDPVYLYPIRAEPEKARALFLLLAQRARDLEERPQFYNTFTNNCTTAILDAVNEIASRPIPYGLQILLPGYSDRLAHERGLIDTDLTLDEARKAFEVNARARAAIGTPEFSLRIRG
jgi:hypothetical protein